MLHVAAGYADLETVTILIDAAQCGMNAKRLDKGLLKAALDVLRGRDNSSDELKEAFRCLVDTVYGSAIESGADEPRGKGKGRADRETS